MNITPTNKPSPGCFGVVRTKGIIPAAIRMGTRSQVNHAFLVIGQNHEGDWLILEAQTAGAVYANLSKYADLEVVFSEPIPAQLARRVTARAIRLWGTPYNFLDIAALFFLSLGIRWRFLLDRAQRSSRLICSQLVDRAYRNAGLILFTDGRPDGEVTPGDLLMYVAQGLRPAY